MKPTEEETSELRYYDLSPIKYKCNICEEERKSVWHIGGTEEGNDRNICSSCLVKVVDLLKGMLAKKKE